VAGPGATGRDREESRGPGRCAGVRLDIWTDIVCPFCYLGRARLEEAVAGFEHRDEVELVWHSFELDRDAPAVSEQTVVDLVAQKYGASREQMVAQHESLAAQMRELGLPVDFDRARHGNTFDAHRVVHLATEHGLGGEMHARLLRAYFAEGLAIGDREVLADLAAEVGLDRDEVVQALAGHDYGNHVRSDEATAKMIGITGVPFVVLDRKYGVSGAQPTQVFADALATAWEHRHEVAEPVATGCGGGCGPDGCAGACAS
jgi:predicted DsbA family dithiol-disulfide isomerase